MLILACLAACFAALPSCTGRMRATRATEVHRGESNPGPKAGSRENARQKFERNIDGWASWLMGVLILVGVAALIVSFTTLGATLGISTAEAGIVLGLSSLVPVLGYILSAWGVLAADVLTIGLLVLTLLIVAGWSVKRLRGWFPSWFRLRRTS